jgi:hypothetical protein
VTAAFAPMLAYAMLGGFLALPITLFALARLHRPRRAPPPPCTHESLNAQFALAIVDGQPQVAAMRLRCWGCGWQFTSRVGVPWPDQRGDA